jgi:hypothetical protein
MKRMVLLILVLVLLVDITEDVFLGKVKFCLPNHSAKTSVTSSHYHPGFSKIDTALALAFQKLPGSPRPCNARPLTLRLLPTLQIIHCCHLSSSGGIPL